MNRYIRLATLAAAGLISAATPALAQTAQDESRFRTAEQRFDNEYRLFQQEIDRYQASRRVGYDRGPGGYNDPRYDPRADDRYENYDASRYYRPGSNYQERVLGPDDRVYAGNDGRYYCKRSDGTTGLILGAGAGGVLGNVIDGGHSRAVGTLLGAALGAVAGKAIDQNGSQVRCR